MVVVVLVFVEGFLGFEDCYAVVEVGAWLEGSVSGWHGAGWEFGGVVARRLNQHLQASTRSRLTGLFRSASSKDVK